MRLPSVPVAGFDPRRLWRPGAVGSEAGAPDGADGPLFDEALLGRLRRLTLLSRASLAEGLAGEHRSRRRGASPEFSDFKSYSQGDDFRRIDWSTYARLDGLFVRLSEVTTEFDVHVLLDASNSMAWRGTGDVPTKFAYARRAAGALGYVALWHFDRLTVAPFGATLAPRFGPAQGRSHAVPLLRYLERLPPLGGTDLPSVLDAYAHARRRPGILLLVSDLLSGEPTQVTQVLRDLRGRGWQTTVVHTLDPAELEPGGMLGTGGGRASLAELVDVEGGERLRLTPTDGLLDRYRAAVGAWLAETESACAADGVDYVRLMTDWPFETIVLRLLHDRGVVA